MLQLLTPEGELLADPPMDLDLTRRLFQAMVIARQYDRKATSIQKQGRLATYAPFEGQEAAQIGSAAALRPDDWMVPTYRDAAAMWMQGYPWTHLLLTRMGDERGGSPPEGIPVLPPSITVGAHMLHAVGLAWAERLQGSDRIAITYFGDGATSEGDFHEAMNFAGVFQTGTVFVCQNNQYAISLSRQRQTASETIAGKANGYGVPGVLVDGNDLFAMYQATTEAVVRARDGRGATLIEALTYRLGPHTTSDDPSRYREAAEVDEWRAKDPIDRVRRYLVAQDAWDEAWEAGIAAEAHDEIDRAVDEAEALPALAPAEIFEAMYADMTPELAEQQRWLLESRKDRSLTPGELTGATFTVSNIGAVGGGHGTPIIPYGTTAILSVGRAEPQAVVRDGAVTIARMMPLSLSYDHRVIDGGLGRRFIARLRENLEEPGLFLAS
jgi:pyruvate dehydrogenase E1 component alpha subunit